MRAFVLTDRSLARYAGRFVWLAIDIDNSANSAFLVKFPVTGTPTLMVIDPKSEALALRYLGSASVPQLELILRDGAGAVRGKQISAGIDAEAQIVELRHSRDFERCASRALELYPQFAGTASGASIADRGLTCAVRQSDPSKTAALAKAVRAEAENPKNGLIDGDRAGLYLDLISELRRAKDEEGMRTLREQLAVFLEARAAAAKTPAQRAAFDHYRIRVYRELGQPEKSIPMLEQTERDFPTDYVPPLWISRVYQSMGKYDEALAASDRALARVSGAARVMVLDLRSDVYAAKGDREIAAQTLREAIALSESLPAGLHDAGTTTMLKKKLERM
jgi:tetratricopeptide (TPR) repeat protein